MRAAFFDLTIEQGATFRQVFRWQDKSKQPFDLTGFTAKLMMRQSVASPSTLKTLTTENGVTVLASREGLVSPLALAGQTGVSLESIMGQAASIALTENEQLKGVNAQLALLTQTLQQRLDEANAKLAALGAETSLVASNTSGENVSEV